MEGKDTWSGRLPEPNVTQTDGPLRTIWKASGLLAQGDTCFIREGTYHETIVPMRSGDSLRTIVYTNYQDEKVVLSGCDMAMKKWTKVSDHIYKIPFKQESDENMIFIDGVLAPEARWPNDSGDLLRPSFGTVDGGTHLTMKANGLPDGIDLKGAVLQGFFGKEWALQTMVITAYDPKTKTVTFPEPKKRIGYYGGPEGWKKRYEPRAGNRFYVKGHYDLLDANGEWYYNDTSEELFIFFEENPNASSSRVAKKLRDHAIDLSDRRYVEISGLDILGAGILTNENTSYCSFNDIKGVHIDPGIVIHGNENEVRNCEFSYSKKGLVHVAGDGHRIINNYIHDGNYLGTWDQLLSTKGSRHLVSHNTVSRAGGGCIGPGGVNMRFQYNEVGEAGLIRHDIGGFYIANNDGAGTVIHHNRVHEVYGIGIYLDNSTSNYNIHHNVVWNCGWEYILSKPPPSFLSISAYDAIRLNTPGNHNLVYNNTCYNTWGLGYWGRNFEEDMYGDHVINNIFTGSYAVSESVVSGYNLHKQADPLFENPTNLDFRLTAGSPAIDKGMHLQGVTQDYIGSAPDIGAYEHGKEPWQAGHDFTKDPNPVFADFSTDYQNLVKNGGFEKGMEHWIDEPSKARLINEDSWGLETARTRMQNHSVSLPGTARIQQKIHLRDSGEYRLSGWIKASQEGEKGQLMVHVNGRTHSKDTFGNSEWEFLTIEFKTAQSDRDVLIGVKNIGNNLVEIFVDDIGLIRKMEE